MNNMKKIGVPATSTTAEFALNTLVNIKLGVIDAKSQMLDQDPKAVEAMDLALYSYYMNKNVDSKYKDKVFSGKEIAAYYQKNPLVKIQRLTYSFSNQVPGSMEKAKIQMNVLRGELKSKKITFESAMEKTQDKAIPALTGMFDKVIVEDLAPQEALELKPLKPLEISAVIQGGQFFAILRIVKVYPYSSDYTDDINDRMKGELITSARDKYSKVLRQKYATIVQVNK
jgi:hypothetical protein